MKDTRIVYGAQCTWWDTIDKVGTKGFTPCCPYCTGMLFEMESPKEWWASVERYQNKGNPGYREFVEWQQGECFPDRDAAMAAYKQRKVVH